MAPQLLNTSPDRRTASVVDFWIIAPAHFGVASLAAKLTIGVPFVGKYVVLIQAQAGEHGIVLPQANLQL